MYQLNKKKTFFIGTFFLCIQMFSQINVNVKWHSTDTYDLPQNSVKSIAVDKYGFLWLTTEKGIVKFDGKKFKTYNISNSNFSNDRFFYFYGNKQNDSIIAYNDLPNERVLIKNRSVKSMSINNATLPILSDENKISVLKFLNKNRIPCTVSIDKKKFYSITQNEIVINFNEKKKSIIGESENTTIFEAYKENLLCVKKNGTVLMLDKIGRTYELNLKRTDEIFLNLIENQIFYLRNESIYLIELKKNKLISKKITDISNLESSNINTIYYDEISKKTFVGTKTKGLAIFSTTNFKVISNNNFYSIEKFSNNTIIANGNEIFNINKLIKVNVINKQETEHTNAAAIDKKGNLWVKKSDTLFKYLKRDGYKTKYSHIFDKEISTLYCDSKNRIWFSIKKIYQEKHNLCYIDANKEEITIHKTKHKTSSILSFNESKLNNVLYFASEKSLMYLDLKKNILKEVNTNLDIRSIFICKSNYIWICTYSYGFFLFKNGKFIKMPSDNTNSLQTSHCIIEDDRGHFWISTNNGLVEADKKDLLKYAQSNTPVYYNHYDKNLGFNTNEFNGGCQPCGLKLGTKEIVFPSMDGIVIFNPENVNKNLLVNQFYISEAIIDASKKICFKDKLELDKNTDRVEFVIDFAYFGNQKNIEIEVLLVVNSENKNKWTKVPEERSISFTNIPAGKHELYVRMKNGFGGGYLIKKIDIFKQYHFYETILFKVICFVFLISIFVYIYKIRLRKIQTRNIELSKIIEEKTVKLNDNIKNLKVTKQVLTNEILQQKKLIGTISHDIKSPLRYLNITAKHLYSNSGSLNQDDLKESTEILFESSSEILNFVDSLINYSNLFLENTENSDESLAHLSLTIENKIKLFKNIASSKSINLFFENNLKDEVYINKKIIDIIIHNLIDNSIKNTEFGEIKIMASEANDSVIISVKDTGQGMTKSILEAYRLLNQNKDSDKLLLQNNGLGLRMIIELTRLIKGELIIESEEKIGTKVSIIISRE